MTYALDTNTISHLLWGEGEAEKHFKRIDGLTLTNWMV
jgi:predicted nucleic acid-binding protein